MPDAQRCAEIVNFFVTTARNRSDTRGFSGYNARDGLVYRWCVRVSVLETSGGYLRMRTPVY